MRISGRASEPVLEFLLDGQTVSAGEAAQSLFSGGNSAAAAASQAQSFVSGLTSGLMALSGRRELGEMMPILMVDPGDESSGARVRAGFELNSLVPSFLESVIRGVYVEGIIASGSDEQQQDTGGGVLLELYLPHDLVTWSPRGNTARARPGAWISAGSRDGSVSRCPPSAIETASRPSHHHSPAHTFDSVTLSP